MMPVMSLNVKPRFCGIYDDANVPGLDSSKDLLVARAVRATMLEVVR